MMKVYVVTIIILLLIHVSLRIPLLQRNNILYTCKGAFIHAWSHNMEVDLHVYNHCSKQLENFNDQCAHCSISVWLYMHASDYEVSRSRVIELHALYILQLKL